MQQDLRDYEKADYGFEKFAIAKRLLSPYTE